MPRGLKRKFFCVCGVVVGFFLGGRCVGWGGGITGGQQSQSCHLERAACMFKKKVNSIKEKGVF